MNDKEKFIVLVDNDCINKSDAIIFLEGDSDNRCQQVVNLYRQGLAPKIVFSGNFDNPQNGSMIYNKIKPLLLDMGVPEEDLIFENQSLNTKEQAMEIVALSKRMNWKKIILVASNYHQYRAYLTFLKALDESDYGLILYNSPARDLLWFSDTGYGTRIGLLEDEFNKINKYKALNHVASFKEAIDYQKWKEQQV